MLWMTVFYWKQSDLTHVSNTLFTLLLPNGRPLKTRPAVRSVMLNLANKFSQCTFSVAEHYDLFSDLIILRQAWWRGLYDDILHWSHQTDRETAAGKAQRYHTDLKLIYMLPNMPHATSQQIRVDGHFKSVRNNRRRFLQNCHSLAKDWKSTLANSQPI